MTDTDRNRNEVNLLTLVPERTREFTYRQDGLVDVLVPRFGTGRMGKVLESFFKRAPIRIKLDRIGSFAWALCDGAHTVGDIGTKLEREFGAKIEPVYDRLALFMSQMEQGRMIRWKNK